MAENRVSRMPDVLKHWRKDFCASLVVFLVALPLCMGIALASGAPVATGLVTGIVGGLVVGTISGAPLQVSGPAAGLTVICGEVIREQGLPALGIVVLFAGIAQLIAGILRLGQWFRAVSPAVIHGMLSGIGVLILASQLHVMVDDRPRHSGVANIASLPESIWKGLPIPTWEEESSRLGRLQLLRTFSMIHEKQGEIERLVERTVTKHGSEELHNQEADELRSLVPEQAKVIASFGEVVDTYVKTPFADDSTLKDDRLRESIDTAQSSLETALANLTGHPLEEAEQSEVAASEALAGVVAALKNHDWAAKVGLLTIAVIILWQGLFKNLAKVIPAPLVAVALATLLCWYLSLPVLYVEVPDNLRDGLTLPSWNVFEDVLLADLIIAGVMVAVIASAETLLCATAVDSMHNGPRTRYDQELAAQGFGNMICGMMGGLPMTGVIVRSATNVQAGGQTRLSAILHGLWILLTVSVMAPFLRAVPVAALAGILVYTGFKLINFRGLKELWHESRSEAFIFLATTVMIVVEDLLFGVITGIVLSSLKLLFQFSHLEADLQQSTGAHGRPIATLSLSGAATFLRLPVLAAKLEQVPSGAELHVDFRNLDYVDHACLELLTNWAKQHDATGGGLVIDWQSLHARFRSGNGKKGAPENGVGVAQPEPLDSAV